MRARYVAVVAASASSVLLAGRTPVAGPQLPGYVVLSCQVSHGVRWQLDAFIDEDGLLCMTVDGPKGPGTQTSWSSGGCGFSSGPSSGYCMAGPGPGAEETDILYGPLPEDASEVRVAGGKAVASHAFAAGSGLPAGRCWLSFGPPKGTDAGRAVDPQPLDASGNKVAFTGFCGRVNRASSGRAGGIL
ncbi:hypothetical protein ABZT48_45495 [Streptomyces avermitilis]|uniref:hypothetical protein n=1 Tax=Streptomyces avermitilis TaxID=33903 RepID=UPI0033A6124C